MLEGSAARWRLTRTISMIQISLLMLKGQLTILDDWGPMSGSPVVDMFWVHYELALLRQAVRNFSAGYLAARSISNLILIYV